MEGVSRDLVPFNVIIKSKSKRLYLPICRQQKKKGIYFPTENGSSPGAVSFSTTSTLFLLHPDK
jgi:hypothetical protein